MKSLMMCLLLIVGVCVFASSSIASTQLGKGDMAILQGGCSSQCADSDFMACGYWESHFCEPQGASCEDCEFGSRMMGMCLPDQNPDYKCNLYTFDTNNKPEFSCGRAKVGATCDANGDCSGGTFDDHNYCERPYAQGNECGE